MKNLCSCLKASSARIGRGGRKVWIPMTRGSEDFIELQERKVYAGEAEDAAIKQLSIEMR